MTESAQKLLDLMHERRLLPDVLIDSLRKQVAAAERPLTAHHIAKLLQQKGKITPFQARQLLAEVDRRRSEPEGGGPPAPPATANTESPPASAALPEEAQPETSGNDDELGLALIEEDVPKTQRREAKLAELAASLPEEPSTPQPQTTTAAPSEAPSLAGGIDDLLVDAMLTPFADGARDPLGIAQPQRKRGWFTGHGGGSTKRKPQGDSWESPLIIVGGGALLLLIIVGVTLAFVLLRSSGDELFKAAELDYANGLYGQATTKYQKFLKGRENHPQASLARVRIAVGQLRAAATGDPQAALKQAQTLLPPLESEPALAEARPELASLLPDIAEKFADAASRAASVEESARQIDAYRQAMQLVDRPNYLPTSVRAPLTARLARMQEKIDVAVRQVEQQDKLRAALARIQAAAHKQDAAAAYRIHHDLLQLYPRLRANEELRAAVVAVSAGLREQVVVDRNGDGAVFAGETFAKDHPSPALAEISLVKMSGERVPPLAGQVVPVVVDGALYVLAADDGRLLWRRFVGRDAISARMIDDTPDVDVLVVDGRRNELLRLRARDGQLVWRLACEGEILLGAQHAGEIYVTLLQGMLLAVASDTGKILRQARFPQGLSAAAAMSPSGELLVQCGDHSNVYVLKRSSLGCRSVLYAGHQAATIDVPPVFVGSTLLVPQQVGLNRSQLHVLNWHEDDASLHASQSPIAVDQWLAGPLLTAGPRAVAVDRRGGIRVLEATDDGDAVSVAIVAEKSGNLKNESPYAIVHDGWLVVGDQRLTGYRFLTARGTLPASWVSHEGDEFVAPLHAAGDYVFHARRQPGKVGVTVSAASLAPKNTRDVGQPVWQTQLALEPAGAVSQTPDSSLQAACDSGDRFTLPAQASGSMVVDTPDAAEPAESRQTRGMSHARIPWRDGFLWPNDRGQIEFQSSAANLFPFQPARRPGQTIAWLSPAVIDNQRFIAAERSGRVWLVGENTTGAPHLAAAMETEIAGPLVAGPMVYGQQAFVLQRGEESDRMVSLQLRGLEPSETHPLPGRVLWGPLMADDVVLVAVEPGGLLAMGTADKELWLRDIDGELPVGQPVVVGDSVWLATTAGCLRRLSCKTGEVERKLDFLQPLASGPAIFDARLYVRAADGSVLIGELQP